ncbi:acyl-coenzyme A thioesterase 9, mitochondrial-like [Strongylocentrotus purpuratus]|uniref:HotDog ACOT-type domain-containing protein n=1 Tax=Strongylocentrotus purpuratus TaxID=7668 RepID=A0A7M7NL37_STRPU|nr:acyl-coenzyme A thioesterase 9, mitochondrial-like [Strongylocentrotus purpuratus]
MSVSRLWRGFSSRLPINQTLLSYRRTWRQPQRCIISYSKTDGEILTVKQMRKKMVEFTGAQKQWSLDGKNADRSALSSLLAQDQTGLEPRKISDSYDEICIPLSDPVQRDKYMNMYNSIRIGRILEDIDMFGVWLCYRHSKPAKAIEVSPLVIVTGLVDRIDMSTIDIIPDKDLRLTGHVTWVGKTSIEVTINLEQMIDSSYSKILEAKIVNVARDPLNKRPAFINPLVAESEEESEELIAGNARKVARQERSKASLLKTAPVTEEREIIHKMFVESLPVGASSFSHRIKPDNATWMDETKLKNVIICFPQERNLFNKIFGGFLMRQALELAFASATLHSHGRIRIAAIDNILFQKPVEVGSFLFFLSEIAYTEGCYMEIRVHSEVVDPRTGEHDTTNVFHFTIVTENPVPLVWPKTYGESMLYLDGRRRFLEYKRINQVTDTSTVSLTF